MADATRPGAGGAPTLRYTAPPEDWVEALPVGNGRIGAMVFAGTTRARLQVNDDTCWSGAPRLEPVRGADLPAGRGPDVVQAARRALAEGDVREAERQVKRLQGGYPESYQPLVDLWLTLAVDATVSGAAPGDYRRWLDLAQATAGHSWTVDDMRVEQEVFASRPAGALVLHRTSTAPTDVEVAVTSVHDLRSVESAIVPKGAVWSAVVRMPAAVLPAYVPTGGSGVTPSRAPGDGVTCAVAVQVLTDGQPAADGSVVRVRGATWVTVLLTSESDYAGASVPLHGDDARLRAVALQRLGTAADTGVQSLRAEHVADHGALFDRVALRLGTGGADMEARPEVPVPAGRAPWSCGGGPCRPGLRPAGHSSTARRRRRPGPRGPRDDVRPRPPRQAGPGDPGPAGMAARARSAGGPAQRRRQDLRSGDRGALDAVDAVDDLRPAIVQAFDAFGPDRVMFGSDWPVVNLASDYQQWRHTAAALLPPSLDRHQRSAFWGGNARRIYGVGGAPA